MSRSRTRQSLAPLTLMAAISLPTHNLDKWQVETYSRIPSNIVSFSKTGILIKLNGSAGPLIFPLSGPTTISGFRVRGEFRGLPKFKDVSRQGERTADDYPLRIGFVIPGDRKLSGLKKMFAPEWVKKLYEKAPKDSGISHIQFFDVTQNPLQVGKGRIHPASDLIHEEFFALAKESGPFDFKYQIKTPLKAIAVWISIDGDDTGSTYDVLISDIELNTQ